MARLLVGNRFFTNLLAQVDDTMEKSRSLKRIALRAFGVFAACFVSFYVDCAVSAGTLAFWHKWNWFV
jgi:hypothetical protein